MASWIEFSSIPSYYNSQCWYSKEEMDVPISQIHSEMKQQPSNIPSSGMINQTGILKIPKIFEEDTEILYKTINSQ